VKKKLTHQKQKFYDDWSQRRKTKCPRRGIRQRIGE
jgi:hypothetical protein